MHVRLVMRINEISTVSVYMLVSTLSIFTFNANVFVVFVNIKKIIFSPELDVFMSSA